jgi:hypothetical protein
MNRETDMNNEILNSETSELTIDELDIVSGGTFVSLVRAALSKIHDLLDPPIKLKPFPDVIELKPFPT